MLKTRFNEIEKLTLGILSQLNIGKAPIDLEKIADSYKINLTCYDLGDEISGMLVLNGEHATIGFNCNNIPQRQRFTIAHELGHYFLHKPKGNDVFIDKDFLVRIYRGDKTYTDRETKQEQEANAFAAALLMPKSFIDAEIRKKELFHLNETDLINELSRTFDVSVAAMSFRLTNIGVTF